MAAVASFLDARAQRGQWLVRIEDLDTRRTVQGAAELILQQLSGLGMHWDREVTYQSQRLSLYQQAFEYDAGFPCEPVRMPNRLWPCDN